MNRAIILGTRGSRLASAQTEEIRKILLDRFPTLEIESKVIKTDGDQDTDSHLSSFEGRGAFVQSLEKALLAQGIDIAIHSLKDLPSKLQKGLLLGAVPVREDTRDILITKIQGFTLKTLPKGSVLGTGSERRRVQLKRIRPDLRFKDIRGNIETRIDKLTKEGYDAIILAAAALKRLGLISAISEYIEYDNYISAPCQGALGLECRADDTIVKNILCKIDNPDVRICVDTERLFISTLGMGCHTPVGAFANIVPGGIDFKAFVATSKGTILEKAIHARRRNILKAAHDLAVQFRITLNTHEST